VPLTARSNRFADGDGVQRINHISASLRGEPNDFAA
jgi:hypothetical protein